MAKAAKKRRITPRKAFTTYHPSYGINPFYLRAEANMVRSSMRDWERVKKSGWRVVRVKVIPDFQ